MYTTAALRKLIDNPLAPVFRLILAKDHLEKAVKELDDVLKKRLGSQSDKEEPESPRNLLIRQPLAESNDDLKCTKCGKQF